MKDEFVRKTTGVVANYIVSKGSGWITPDCDKHNDAFVSHRDVDQPEPKKLLPRDCVEFDLYLNKNPKYRTLYYAKDVKLVSAEKREEIRASYEDSKFNSWGTIHER